MLSIQQSAKKQLMAFDKPDESEQALDFDSLSFNEMPDYITSIINACAGPPLAHSEAQPY